MSDVRTVYQKARIETCRLLGYGDDIDALSAERSTRLDLAVALRMALDDQAAKLLRGESTDVSKLLSASEALAKLLPATVLAEPPPTRREDPRVALWKVYLGMRRRGEVPPKGWFQHRIDEQAAKITELESELAELKAGSPAEPTAVPPPPDNVVALPRATAGLSAQATPAAPPAKPFVNGTSDLVARYAVPDEPWQEYANAHYDPWSDNR
jgi:hypothetical protein